MAVNKDPIFTDTPNVGIAELSTANTNRDGTGTIVDLFTAQTDGSKPSSIKAIAKAATTNGIINLFIYNGSAWLFWCQMAVTAITPSATVKAWEAWLPEDDLEKLSLLTSWKLGAAPTQAETFNVIAYGGDF